ncbi:Phage terminase, small subunit [Mycobacterium marinum]|uniref:Phage terminase, small subunit n=1 Tax=Mycobacterium marinum TaxID=1781 RepID=A0A3E2N2C8_MYCMR|nr:phage terminase small subunit P27 family [Mycobacterium marinum]RFZ47547.1 Phage terminase, small subunit [Mycobacterium marinum]
MGGRGSGRIPAPAGLKLLKGTSPGRDSGGRKVPTPPKFDRATPDAPDWLDDEARAEWDRVTPGLERLDLLKPEDRGVLSAYCESWSTYVTAVKQVRAEGITVVTPKSGVAHKNPALAVAETARMHMLRLAAEFGLTPSAEPRLASLPVDSDDADDPFAAG